MVTMRGARRLRGTSVLLVALCTGCGQGDPSADRSAVESRFAERERLDETVWADEVLAGAYERTLVDLWDALLDADRRDAPEAKRDVLAGVPFESLEVGDPEQAESLDHGIERATLSADPRTLDPEAWQQWTRALFDRGLRLVQSEWHHARFHPPIGSLPARSGVAMALHLTDERGERRLVVEGELDVIWAEERDDRGNPVPRSIDATNLRLWSRRGPPVFERILTYRWPEHRTPSRLHPLLLYDLDGDGRSEIVAIGAARVLRMQEDGSFQDEFLLGQPYVLAEAAVLADFDGDANPDLLAARARGDLVLYEGDAEGRFWDAPSVTPHFETPLRAPSSLTVGDVDRDGDLDVWLGQYEPAYRDGQMPTPYYDANDGHPSYLLRNDGNGRLTPATEPAGLAARRWRRTYASSFVDLDDDDDLDLLVVSDYAGVDLYHNDGLGHFTDANDTLVGDRHLFGMSAAFGDYDLDGRLDFFVAGMGSTTARRLDALELGRDDRADLDRMRSRMAYGNRMYLARDDGYHEPDFADQVARTGWTWGTTAFDFDNDGDRDLFAANGHVSGESTEDYCSTFWTHDIYDGDSEPDPTLESVFSLASEDLLLGRMSWDGHQKNRLLMNLGGEGFADVAFLVGVADAFDSRAAVSDDLDLDGRVDLVVVEDHGQGGQRLHVYRNRLPEPGAWIGVQLREQGGGISPVGAKVVVTTPEQTHVARIATGETVMGQHSNTVHFGLGQSKSVSAIEVHWVSGPRVVIEEPELGRYHRVEAPDSGAGDEVAAGG
jgi:hypothetical protein